MLPYPSNLRRSQAFTLIELLVTVGVIGILAACAIANYKEYKKKGYDVATKISVKDAYTSLNASSVALPIDFYYISLNFFPDGTYYISQLPVLAVLTKESVLPGFVHTPGTYLGADFIGNRGYQAGGVHCLGGGQGYIISDRGMALSSSSGKLIKPGNIGFSPEEDCHPYGF